MRVMILGGDGYLGWATAMYLSANGHEVIVVDNYLRRNICREQNIEPLYRIPNLHRRAMIWECESGSNTIKVFIGDLKKWEFVEKIFKKTIPDSIVHFAEQPSAPFSMLNRESATLTLTNNLNVTSNIIFAVRKYCPQSQIIKLGTMGEYGTPNIDIEEGWIDITHNGRNQKFLYPRQASSLYHTTKIMDTDLLWFYVRMWDLRVTDLMQGPVYGLWTDEVGDNHDLLPFYNYDELFGTVLNRFIVQAVAGYPLTVFGKGGQTRGYLNIKDTLKCVRLSIENPANVGELRIFNQFTETFSVNDLAERVKIVGLGIGLKVEINHLENPRKEAEQHYYSPKNTGLLELGLEPIFLSNDILAEMMELVIKYKDNIHKEQIFRNVTWS